MRKWLILLGVVLVVAVIWYFARQQTFIPDFAQPKTAAVSRGDIRVPIMASGLVHPHQAIEVKSEASGNITSVPVVEGTFVKKGEPLLVLDPDDEQRLRDRAQADFERSQALLTQARVAVERAKVNIEAAKSRLEEIAAQASMSAYELQKMERMLNKDGKSDVYTDQQIHDIRAQNRMNTAQQESARIAVQSAELSQQDAEAAVRSQEATVQSARKNLEDAESRLRKTTVLASGDAIVTQVFVKAGMLVQSGTQGIMGGTQLMTLADVSQKKVVARLDEAVYGRVLDISPVDALPDMPGLRKAAEEDAQQIASRSGQVRITVDAFPDKSFTGQIERVEPQGKLNAGSSVIQFDIHVKITDPDRHLLPLGAQAQVEFTVESATDALRVPADAVKAYQDQRGVWLKTAPQSGTREKFGKRFVPCRFGISDGEYTQVIEVIGGGELKAGDEVYTRLPPESRQKE